jgi:N-glycosylase/DNA lyase
MPSIFMKKFNKDHPKFPYRLLSIYQRFDPIMSINSGQVFLWEKRRDSWYGIDGDRVVRLSQLNGHVEFASFPEDSSCEQKMFRLGDDSRLIFSEISRDPFVRKLVKLYPGLRLMRQDPSQCLFSFVCATNTNIPMIRKMLYSMTRKYGRSVRIDGDLFFTFPSATDINRASIDELRTCGVGFRAKAIKAAAGAIASGQLDFDSLKRASYGDAKKALLQIYGIGNKIADCVLLFSLEKLEAFPIDIWITRVLTNQYKHLNKKKFGEKITTGQYEELSRSAREYFGRYAGYAQQYLYYHVREAIGKKW